MMLLDPDFDFPLPTQTTKQRTSHVPKRQYKYFFFFFLSRVHTSKPSKVWRGRSGLGHQHAKYFHAKSWWKTLRCYAKERTHSHSRPQKPPTHTLTQLKLTHGAQHENNTKPFRLENVFIMETNSTLNTARNKKIKSLFINELHMSNARVPL